MKINKSGAKYSAIVGIGERIKNISKETGEAFLLLNRGVNSVCNIDLNELVKEIDFNTNEMQVYPPSQGKIELRKAINKHYFGDRSNAENISICGGGMSALDIVFQTLQVDQIVLPDYYWGSYMQVMTIRGINSATYTDLKYIEENLDAYKNSAVIICDPNNPLGNKQADRELLKHIQLLNDNGTIVIVDCPYRRIFFGEEDEFFQNLLAFENVIVVESFSKSLGLSGQRLGFVHSPNKDFNNELGIRLMYATNGINAFSQILVEKLLCSEKGQKATNDFKRITAKGIERNIAYLRDKNLLANEFYKNSEPVGIFVIVNKSEEELLEKRIGSVSLSYFTRDKKEEAAKYARICVSVPPEKFEAFFKVF
ncbi:pyridoxal phosphate-dependent aminotransferase [Labilibaculum sp. DW002]|uniref:Aminotransferase n=1 Tax=Paralabilibaculum antarcticum TaxID=2912572 RepID=A0ABT5VTE7_9BACT|nr:pyridoxal phosphate-dependent aminotransferase [Labilibaculum sp. DW002]MDE5418704.1 pyridoxal phosphate-dependent aminotransferase [Labilibaculum sp. DW002]